MMGYSLRSKAYKILDVESSAPIVSRDVTFDETSVINLKIEVPISNDSSINAAVSWKKLKKKWKTTFTWLKQI